MKMLRALCLLLVLTLLPISGCMAEEAPELLAWYTFDDAADLGRDDSGQGNTLKQLGQVKSAEGHRGGAAYFDGVSGLIPAGVDFLDEYEGKSVTVSYFARVDLDKAHTGNMRAVDHGVNGCEDAFTTVIKKNVAEDGSSSLTFIGTAGGSDWWGAAADIREDVAAWHRYTLVYDADECTVTTYVDGEKRGECYGDGNGVSSSYIFCIGGSYATADWFNGGDHSQPVEGFIGAVDEVKIIGGVLPDSADIDALVAVPVSDKHTIRVDFSEATGVPLLKRQNTFSPSHSFMGAYIAEFMRDAPTLAEMRPESMRVDLFMGNGGVGGTLGKGTPEHMSSSFMQLDMTLKQFYKGGTLPYVVYFATPEALFDKENYASAYWKYPPVSYDRWSEVCGDIAEHYARKEWPLAAHEIWNEPDWGTAFYGGTWEEYLKIYEYAVKGIREKSPYAMVGGMSLATFSDYYANGNVRQFLDHVSGSALPLDFISYHCYVTNNYPTYTQLANSSLAGYGDAFRTTALHLNEFHVSLDEKVTATEKCVGSMMDAILYTLDHPQITSVNWACFRVSGETGCQMIESRTGKRFAAYHVLNCYNRMPLQRVALAEKNQLKGVASVDDHQAGVILYNRTYKERDYVLEMANLPFDTCDMTIYAIDETHSNYGRNGGSDELAVICHDEGVATDGLKWSGVLPSNGMIYVEIVESGHKADLRYVSAIDGNEQVLQGDTATVLRREYYFEDRSSTMFSEFDLRTFSAWAGMGDRAEGLTRGSAVMTNLPEMLILRPELTREMAAGGNAFLTVEYLNVAGDAQTMHYALDGTGETLPLDGEIVLATPADFDGELRLTWGLQDAGKDVTLKINVDKE